VEATRCTFEDNGGEGVLVFGEAKLVDCVVSNNTGSGVSVNGGKAILVGGTISGNKHGVVAQNFYGDGKVTVAAAERSEQTGSEVCVVSTPAVDRPQTVSSGNDGHD